MFVFAQSTVRFSLKNSRFHSGVVKSPVIYASSSDPIPSKDELKVRTGDNIGTNIPATTVTLSNVLFYFLKAEVPKPKPDDFRYSILWFNFAENASMSNLYFNHIDAAEPEGCCIYVSMARSLPGIDVSHPLPSSLLIKECSFVGVRTQYLADDSKPTGEVGSNVPNYFGFCVRWGVIPEITTVNTYFPTNQVYLYNLLFANCARSINFAKSATDLELPKYMGIIGGVNRNLTVFGANFTRLTLFDYDFADIFRAGSTGIIMVLDQAEGLPRGFTAEFKFIQFCHMRQAMGSLFIAYPFYQTVVAAHFPDDNPILSITSCNFINASFDQMTPALGGVYGQVDLKDEIVIPFTDCFFKKTAFYGAYRMYNPSLYLSNPHFIFTRLYCTLDPYQWLTPRVNILGTTTIQFTFTITEDYFVIGNSPREVFVDGVVNMTFVIPPKNGKLKTRVFTPSAPYPAPIDKHKDYNNNVNNVAGVLAVIFGGFSLLYFLFTLYTRNSAGHKFHIVGDFMAYYSLAHNAPLDKNFRPIEIPEEKIKKQVVKKGKGKGSGSGFSMSTYRSYRSGYGYSRASYSYGSYGSNTKHLQSGGGYHDHNSDYSSEVAQPSKDNASGNDEVVGSGGNDNKENSEGSNELPHRGGRGRPVIAGNGGYSDEGSSVPMELKMNGNGGYSGDGYSDLPIAKFHGYSGDGYSDAPKKKIAGYSGDGYSGDGCSRGKGGGGAKKGVGNGGYSGDGYSLENYEYSDEALPPLQRRPRLNKAKVDPKAAKGPAGKSHKGKHRGNHKKNSKTSHNSPKKSKNVKLSPKPSKKEEHGSISLPPPPWADGIPTDPNEKRLFDTTQTLSTSENFKSPSPSHSKSNSRIEEQSPSEEKTMSLSLPPPPPAPKRRSPYFQIPSVTSKPKVKKDDSSSSSSSSYTCYSSSVSV